ncbi:hypothetical protein H0H87_005427 [Tephrocybe sp. NHM501043]|nr:hypothetical protein H0H87_005427 [Tephrocybe sp. NHM501043]
MNPEQPNAVAGPSTSRISTPPPSASSSSLFLPPPPAPPKTQQTHLSSTQDLLSRFLLLPEYDKYVRPFAAPTETGLDLLGPTPVTPGATGVVDKGKGKETEVGSVTPVAPDGDGDDEEGGKGDKKQRNNYKHLIKGIPGKHSLKKDDYLTTTMLVPPKQRIQIAPFDGRTQREAFAVSLEGLKGWNPNALVLESAQAREDRKKRKEAKRLQKLQVQAALAASVAQPQPIPAPPGSASNRPPMSNGTPRPGSTAPLARPTPVTAGPTAPVQRPGSAVQRPGSTKPPVPRTGSAVPRPGSAAPKNALPPVETSTTTPRIATPLRSAATSTVTPTSAIPYQTTFDDKRGMKRERDELPVTAPPPVNRMGAPHVNGNGNGVAAPPKAIINAKAGTAGIRPRPLKKQRMVRVLHSFLVPFNSIIHLFYSVYLVANLFRSFQDMQGQARDVTVTQQPTPQGV